VEPSREARVNMSLVEADCFGPILGAQELWGVALALGTMTAVHGRYEPRSLCWSVPYAAWVAGWALRNYDGAFIALLYRHLDGWFVHPALWPAYAVGAAVAVGPVLGLAWRRRDLRLPDAAV
jgi:hypothetical protein